MYCKKCGKEIMDENSTFCPYCGKSIEDSSKNMEVNEDTRIFTVISFFIPLLGIIFFFVWYDSHYNRARACLKGVIISVILCFAIWFLLFLVTLKSDPEIIEQSIKMIMNV